jgi:hypothetical protein
MSIKSRGVDNVHWTSSVGGIEASLHDCVLGKGEPTAKRRIPSKSGEVAHIILFEPLGCIFPLLRSFARERALGEI